MRDCRGRRFRVVSPEGCPFDVHETLPEVQYGMCPTYQKQKSPYKEPYLLRYKETLLRLRFDCKNCQMLIYAEE